MQGTWAILKKNCANVVPGVSLFASQSREAFATWQKVYNRTYTNAPTDYRDQAEEYSADYWKKGHSQTKNMWVDKELSEVVSQKELAQLIRYKTDFWRMAHVFAAPLVVGGYAIPMALFWLSNDTWLPSALSTTEEQKREWREAQDLYRYRSIPSYLMETKWNFDFHCYPFTPAEERAWDDLFEKNNVRRDPAVVRNAANMYDHFISFANMKRKSLRHLSRSIPARSSSVVVVGQAQAVRAVLVPRRPNRRRSSTKSCGAKRR